MTLEELKSLPEGTEVLCLMQRSDRYNNYRPGKIIKLSKGHSFVEVEGRVRRLQNHRITTAQEIKQGRRAT